MAQKKYFDQLLGAPKAGRNTQQLSFLSACVCVCSFFPYQLVHFFQIWPKITLQSFFPSLTQYLQNV